MPSGLQGAERQVRVNANLSHRTGTILVVACAALMVAIGAQALVRASEASDGPEVVTSASPTQAPLAAGQVGAGFVGRDTCISCHSDKSETGDGYNQTPHGRRANPRTPASSQGW